MKKPNIDDLLGPILKRDPRYTEEAYFFVREALDHTVRQLAKPRHVSGQELLHGIRDYALGEYGPITKRVLSEWGINECVDFGNIVFNLVNEGLLGKTDEDSIEDFIDGYDFTEAFLQPFRPREPLACRLDRTLSAD
ncbi:MAG: hypothetical protein K9M54_07430 [Kiritimatiellales bacterium]|nr:hypothetical protein [Kiritimatiellales bacterium]MCF7863707.1 hypothetical protein [Kiritimatiellales bacterium]